MSEKSARTEAAKSVQHAQSGEKKGFVARAIQSFLNSTYNTHYMPHI